MCHIIVHVYNHLASTMWFLSACIHYNNSVADFVIQHIFSKLQMDFLHIDKVNDVMWVINVLRQQLITSCSGDSLILFIDVFLSSSNRFTGVWWIITFFGTYFWYFWVEYTDKMFGSVRFPTIFCKSVVVSVSTFLHLPHKI